jgi:energy-coupling factor transport system substrate-specific component
MKRAHAAPPARPGAQGSEGARRNQRARKGEGVRRASDVLVHAAGAFAFLWPFFLHPGAASDNAAHAGDAPWLFAVLGALLVFVAVSDLRAGRMDAKHIAALGVLSAINATLRLPGALGGAGLMYVLPILCGAAFGARFGFMLGATSMAASAVITGGIGPWMPFQMWALGWVGAGGVLAGAALPKRARILALVAYGWIAGILFGALMNLWFWPFQRADSPIAWAPGLGALGTIARYWRFTVVTSLAWDSARALGNAVIIALLGPAILGVLERFRSRLQVRWDASSMAP